MTDTVKIQSADNSAIAILKRDESPCPHDRVRPSQCCECLQSFVNEGGLIWQWMQERSQDDAISPPCDAIPPDKLS